jgi:hydrogenase nickel incorporation protein HypA/HybF
MKRAQSAIGIQIWNSCERHPSFDNAMPFPYTAFEPLLEPIMHELSIMRYLLETVDEQARQVGASRVAAINLVIGARASMVDDSIRFAFELLTAGTLAAGARLNIRHLPMRFHCPRCQLDFSHTSDDFRCPHCHAIGELKNEGREFLLESIEVELPDEDKALPVER